MGLMTDPTTKDATMNIIRLGGNSARNLSLAALLPGAICLAALVWPDVASATDRGMYCSTTAATIHRSCQFEATDDFYKARAICINASENDERQECQSEALAARTENLEACDAELDARREVCAAVGEGRYDPEFDELDHETDYRNPTRTNPYFPLRIGNKAELRGGGEVVSIEVLNRTKLIDEVRCIVVRDIVSADGKLREATDDWFAVATGGDVWYCGEEVKDYEYTPGDRPQAPQLVSRDGSFKAGVDGDKPGIAFLGAPSVGRVYREEFSIGNAEDVSRILSINYGYGDVPELDRLVPANLARLLCARDCVVTKAFSAMEPGIFEIKYYARGIGQFLNVKPHTGEVAQLTSCNYDPRCSSLPRL
jgi:hypothetical protein